MNKQLAMSVVAVSITVGYSAHAADMPVRPGVAAPAAVAPAVVMDWTGFNVGIHGGGGWAHESFERSVSECAPQYWSPCSVNTFVLPADASPKGGVFGFQFGHNWQWGRVVGGLEVDFSGADLTGSSTFSLIDGWNNTNLFRTDKKIDELASIRGRIGYLIIPNLLLYGTAGAGWGHERVTFTASQISPKGVLLAEEDATSFNNMFGVVAGVGLEWKFWPGNPN